MMGITHIAVGTATFIAVNSLIAPPSLSPTPVDLGAVFFGSLIPDIDHPKSWLGRRLWFVSYPLSQAIGHRGLTHSLAGLVIVSCIACVAFLNMADGNSAILAFAIGYIMHLAADWNTNSGVPWLWPNNNKFKAPWAFNTGSLAEVFISILMVGLVYLVIGKEAVL
jgi:inner membrane protein